MAQNEAARLAPIGFVGAGQMAQALAVRFALAGHDVMLSNSGGRDTLGAAVAATPGTVHAGTVAQAAAFGPLVVVAIPVPALQSLPSEPFSGRIVIDATNYYPEPARRVRALDADETSSSELLASLLPDSRVVKAFNTIYFRRLLDDSRPDLPPEERLAIPVAGDDPKAKRAVIDLIDQIGFTGVDAGTLAASRRQQPGSPLYAAYAESRRHNKLLVAQRLRQLIAESSPRSSPEGGRS